MEAFTNNGLPFIGMETMKIDHRLATKKGLFLHYQSYLTSGTDGHLQEMRWIVQSACHPLQISFSQNRNNLDRIFFKLKYPGKLINSTIRNFQRPSDPSQPLSDRPSDSPARRRLRDLGKTINQVPQFLPTKTSLLV